MIVKTEAEDLQNYLTDASNLPGGAAAKLFLPETTEDAAEIMRQANVEKIPVTISGARTGTVGGAIPFGGWLVSPEKLNRIIEINKNFAVVESGVLLTDLQKAAAAENLFYPPDPTEWSCQIGGTIATNASGARSFKYGATREFVRGLKIVLADGEILDLRRGENFAENDFLKLKTRGGREISIKLPTYRQPSVRKNTSGYFTGDRFDAVDLFIGSEGTLGIITEIELKLLPKTEAFLSGIVFFENENDLLAFADEAKQISIKSSQIENPKIENRKSNRRDFDRILRQKFARIYPRKICTQVPGNGKRRDIFRAGNDCGKRRRNFRRVERSAGKTQRRFGKLVVCDRRARP